MDDKEILEMIKEIGAVVREEEKKIESANNIIKRMEEGAGKDILKATLGASEDTLIKYKRLTGWLAELRMRRNVEKWTCVEDGTIPRGEPCVDAISRQKAIRRVKEECNPYGKPTIDFESGKEVIKLLKRIPPVTVMPKSETVTEFADRCRECGARYGRLLKQQPCEDAISRQAVEDAIYDATRSMDLNYSQIMDYIDKLPPITPQPKQSIDRVCDILAEMFETPCDYRFNDIDIDEFMSEDGYCENHCSDGCYGECWKRFFEKYDKFSKESKNEDSN